MLISQAGKLANLTKKAIEYYTEQGLVFPDVLDNGYRNFSEDDVERLKKIYVFRKLGLSTEEIKAVLADETNSTLQRISVLKELNVRREQAKKAVLYKLGCDESYDQINAELKSIEQSSTVAERLLEAFPGYYGRFICLHFAQFLNEPIVTEEQHKAYEEIITFLDNAPSLDFPEELKSFLIENTKYIGTEDIENMVQSTKKSIEDPDKFLSENKEVMEQYLAFRQSEEYKNSPVYKIQTMLKRFNSASGYYDVFIPAMQKLSSSYAKYYKQLEIANEKLLSQYPGIAKLSD